MLYIPQILKTCSKCQELKPFTQKHFNRNKRDGLCQPCRQCNSRLNKEYRQTEQAKISRRNHRAKNKDKINTQKRDYYAKHAERIKAKKRLDYQANPDKYKVYDKRYRAKSVDKRKILQRKWYENNKTKAYEYSKQWTKQNRDKARASVKKWELANPTSRRIRKNRRAARIKCLPATFTFTDWQKCLEYWEYRCAYCDRPRGLWHTLAQDHLVPVTKNGGYTPSNIVPACQGEDGCNQSKGNRDVSEWLEIKFGKHKAAQVLAKIADYVKWLNERE